MELRDRIGIIIVKHLGSKNPDYAIDSHEAKKFVDLADELSALLKRNYWKWMLET